MTIQANAQHLPGLELAWAELHAAGYQPGDAPHKILSQAIASASACAPAPAAAAPSPADCDTAFAARYNSDPADPAVAEVLAIWREAWTTARPVPAVVNQQVTTDASLPVGVPDESMVEAASAAYERAVNAGATHEQAWHEALSVALAAAPAAQPAAICGKYSNVLRPFMAMMEAELHANTGKGDRPAWLAMSPEQCLLEIYYHTAKLQKAVKNNDMKGVREYTADVANMSMMLADTCGWLDVVSSELAANEQKPMADLIREHRIAITPEHEGQWHADLYGSEAEPLARAEGATPEAAVAAVVALYQSRQEKQP